MTCSACGSPTVAFVVPAVLREHAPGDGSVATVCTTCLRTAGATEGDVDPAFDRIADVFPRGEAGVALALALGKLGSLALEREAIVALCEHAEREGADVLLTLDRLADAPGVDPYFDVERRRVQLEQFL
jgi:hypothetical protein